MSSPDTEFISILGTATGGTETPVPKPISKSLPDVLPVLGLSDIVIFPGMIAPLLVDSSQSIRLIDDVVAGDRFLCLVLQRRPEVQNPLPEDLWPYGCAARVSKMLKYPDNTVRVLVEGLRRVELKEFETQEPYLRAIFGFVGITDVQFISAQPMDITPEMRENAIAAALKQVQNCVANSDWTAITGAA